MGRRALWQYAAVGVLGVTLGWLGARLMESGGPAPASTIYLPVSDYQSGGDGSRLAPVGRPPEPPATLAEILRIPSDYLQTAALYNLGAGASAAQLEALLDEARTLSQVSERRAATSILYSRYAELDPEAAVDHVLERGGVFAGAWLGSIFHGWSRRDLPAAVARAAALPLQYRAAAGAALLNARDDLTEADRREIAAQLEIEPLLRQLETQRQAAVTDTDPDDAWQTALATENLQLRVQRLLRVAAAWAGADPVGAMAAVSALPASRNRDMLQQTVVTQWAQHDPRGAAEWAFAQPQDDLRPRLLGAALGQLARAAPFEAIGLARDLAGRERAEALGQVLAGWAAADARAAAAWLESATDAPVDAVVGVASAFAQQHPGEAFEWAVSLSPAQSPPATSIVLSFIGQNEPARAAQLVARMTEANGRASAANSLVQSWAQTDPRAAGEWIGSYEAGAVRADLYRALLQQWSRHNRGAAMEFLDRIPTRSERDAAVLGIIVNVGDDLALAERLYESIVDPQQRRAAARQLYAVAMRHDPARAEQFRRAAEPGG